MRALAFELVLSLLSLGPASGADLLIVVNKSDNTVSILDAKTGAVRDRHRVGQAPHEAELLADGHTTAISNYGTQTDPGSTLTLIDLDRSAPSRTVDLGSGTRPHGLRALRDGRLLVTAEGTKQLLLVDPKPGRVTAKIATNQEISHMVVASPDGSRAYVANIGSGSVSAIDLASGAVLQNIPTGKGAEGIEIAPDGREVWVTNRAEDTVSILDARTLAILATLKVPQFPIRAKMTPDGKRALISCARSGDIAVVDVAGRKEVARISLGLEAVEGSERHLFATRFGKSPAPVGLLIALDGKRAWVASTNANVISEIDLTHWKVSRRLEAGREPDGLAGRFGK